MFHLIEIGVEMKTLDNNSMFKGDGMGPVTTLKKASFFGMGTSLDDAIKDAHEKMTAFLTSDAVKIGAEDKPRVMGLAGFPSKPPLTEQ